MTQVGRIWAPPRLVPYEKHRPPPHIAWNDLIADTEDGNACYHPDITPAVQAHLETQCLQRTPFNEVRHKRMYFGEVNRIVGASEGEETRYLYVECLTSGEAHGRPITAAELRRKGAQL